MHTRTWKIILSIGLSVVVVFALVLHPQLELPAPDGSYAVGQTVIHWVDASRPEVLTEDPNDVREVVALAWYPAEAGTGAQTGYFPNLDRLSQALVESKEVAWWEVAALRFVRSQILIDAIPLKGEGPFPVVIFSPGNGTNMEFYSSLAGEIASHGYVVLGLNHPYDVPAVELSSGDVAVYEKEQWSLEPEAHQVYTAERIKVRTADMLYVLDQLDDMNSAGRFAGILDLGSVVAAGHSLGGITASEACKADTRFKACLNYDGLQQGGPFSMDEAAIPPEQPFLFLTKEAELHPRLLERFESTPESYWVVVHSASHQSFTDGPMLQSFLWPGPNQAGRWMDLIQQYSLAFLDHTLKGQPRDLLSRTLEQADVSVKVFPSN
ncbi:MAG TPA: alpha/beta fold hydrolase [Anaerolineales bacterium]|nr:alpha/beta fold hydrolase [Anaerolineales bacterium]